MAPFCGSSDDSQPKSGTALGNLQRKERRQPGQWSHRSVTLRDILRDSRQQQKWWLAANDRRHTRQYDEQRYSDQSWQQFLTRQLSDNYTRQQHVAQHKLFTQQHLQRRRIQRQQHLQRLVQRQQHLQRRCIQRQQWQLQQRRFTRQLQQRRKLRRFSRRRRWLQRRRRRLTRWWRRRRSQIITLALSIEEG